MAAPLSDESKHAVQQVGLLALQRLAQLAAGVFFVALVPRAMGPEMYGQFVTLQTMSMWFTSLSGLGAVSLMTRFVPEFVERGDYAGLRKLAGSLLTIRLINGLLGAAIYFVIVRVWLRDLETLVIVFVAVSIALRTVANMPFTLLLGLNQASRWGVAELMRRLLLFPLAYLGVRLAGLPGACAALGLVEGSILCVGLWWTRGQIDRPRRPDREFLRPFLQFSAMFLAGNVVIMFFEQGGTPLVRLISGDYAQAGYYAIAFGAYLAGASALWKLLSGFGPLFSSLQIRGRTLELQAWIDRLLRAQAVAGVIAVGFLYSCSDLLATNLLGHNYEPVAPLLPWFALAGLAGGPGNIARVLSVSFSRWRIPLQGAGTQLTMFVGAGIWLIPKAGAYGGALAVLAATSLFSLYSTWQIRSSITYSMRPWITVVGLGLACSPALWAWSGAGPLRFALFLLLFAVALATLGVVRLSEGRMFWSAIRYGATATSPDSAAQAVVAEESLPPQQA